MTAQETINVVDKVRVVGTPREDRAQVEGIHVVDKVPLAHPAVVQKAEEVIAVVEIEAVAEDGKFLA